MAKKPDTLNGGKKIIEFTLDSGQVVYVNPLSIYHLRALRDRAAQLFPYPDPKTYERSVDPDKALFPDDTVPAEQNPAYQMVLREINEQRRDWINEQTIALTVEFPVSRDDLIAQYADERERLAAVMDLPDDEWEATLQFCILRTTVDRAMVIQAAVDNLQLTEAEVRDGMRFFRPILQSNGLSSRAGQTGTPGAATDQPLPTRDAV